MVQVNPTLTFLEEKGDSKVKNKWVFWKTNSAGFLAKAYSECSQILYLPESMGMGFLILIYRCIFLNSSRAKSSTKRKGLVLWKGYLQVKGAEYIILEDWLSKWKERDVRLTLQQWWDGLSHGPNLAQESLSPLSSLLAAFLSPFLLSLSENVPLSLQMCPFHSWPKGLHGSLWKDKQMTVVRTNGDGHENNTAGDSRQQPNKGSGLELPNSECCGILKNKVHNISKWNIWHRSRKGCRKISPQYRTRR